MNLFNKMNDKTSRRQALKTSVALGAASVIYGTGIFSEPALSQTIDKAAVVGDDLPRETVKALHSAFGEHRERAVHAKGVVLYGSFVPAPDAQSITKAKIFTEKAVPVIVRFSDFTGIPDIPDNIGDANPRGLAIKFVASGNEGIDTVSHSFNGFPTKTSEEFAQLFRAIGASGATATKPTALDTFLNSHPIAKTFLTTQKPAPESFATVPFFSVNAFVFLSEKMKKTYVRYRFVPQAGEKFLNPEEIASKGPNYLATEIAERVHAGPIFFDWFAQIAETTDLVDDPSIAWPEVRKLVKLGTIKVDRIAQDQIKASKELSFNPGRLPDGIEIADPMLAVRKAAYPISLIERQ